MTHHHRRLRPSRRTSRDVFISDQAAAAAAETNDILATRARADGHAVAAVDEATLIKSSAPYAVAIRGHYLSRLAAMQMTWCSHLDASAPQPEFWSSAAPTISVCRDCVPTMNSLLEQAGRLPPECANPACRHAPVGDVFRVALAHVMLTVWLCHPCWVAS